MNTTEEIERAARTLSEARAARVAVPPISETHRVSGLDAAYRVAEVNTGQRLRAGRRIVGKKIGLTSRAVQQQLGVDQPDFGVLFDDMEFLDGAEIPTQLLLQPKIEAEVALVMGSDLPAAAPSWSEFLRAVAYALPALEIVDSAIAGWKITFLDTVADNASSGLYVLGNQPLALGALDLGAIGMELRKNGQPVSVGTGAACLGHPLRAAHWLARTMAARGQPLRAGEVLLSGALGPMVPVGPGDLVQADLGALGAVSCRFA